MAAIILTITALALVLIPDRPKTAIKRAKVCARYHRSKIKKIKYTKRFHV